MAKTIRADRATVTVTGPDGRERKFPAENVKISSEQPLDKLGPAYKAATLQTSDCYCEFGKPEVALDAPLLGGGRVRVYHHHTDPGAINDISFWLVEVRPDSIGLSSRMSEFKTRDEALACAEKVIERNGAPDLSKVREAMNPVSAEELASSTDSAESELALFDAGEGPAAPRPESADGTAGETFAYGERVVYKDADGTMRDGLFSREEHGLCVVVDAAKRKPVKVHPTRVRATPLVNTGRLRDF